MKLDIRDGHDAFSFTIVLLLGVVMSESSNSSVNNDLSFILRTKMTLISLLSLKCTVDPLIYINLPDSGDHHHHPSPPPLLFLTEGEQERERERQRERGLQMCPNERRSRNENSEYMILSPRCLCASNCATNNLSPIHNVDAKTDWTGVHAGE